MTIRKKNLYKTSQRAQSTTINEPSKKNWVHQKKINWATELPEKLPTKSGKTKTGQQNFQKITLFYYRNPKYNGTNQAGEKHPEK